MAGRRFTVDVVIDPGCPWCFIGKRNLEQALETLIKELPTVGKSGFNKDTARSLDVEVNWRSFQLNPGMQGSQTLTQDIEARCCEEADTMWDLLDKGGAQHNLEFTGDSCLVVDTIAAHCLIAHAREQGTASHVVEELFRAGFQRSENITDPAVLMQIAQDVGVQGAKEWINVYRTGQKRQTHGRKLFDQLCQKVTDDTKEWTDKHRISGVPMFVISADRVKDGIPAPRPVVLSGGQSPDRILEALRLALAPRPPPPKVGAGPA